MKPLVIIVCSRETYSKIEDDLYEIGALNPAMDFSAALTKTELAVARVMKICSTSAAFVQIPKNKNRVLFFATQSSFKDIDAELRSVFAKNPDLFFAKMIVQNEKMARDLLDQLDDKSGDGSWQLN